MGRALLCQPFQPDQIRHRDGQGGRTYSYVGVHSVIARLNEGCDEWSFEILEHHVLEEEVVVLAKLTADGVVKTSFGGSTITRDKGGRPISIADDLKSAGSDSLKKGASLLGVGLELYGAPPPSKGQASVVGSSSPSDRATDRQLTPSAPWRGNRTSGEVGSACFSTSDSRRPSWVTSPAARLPRSSRS